MMSRNARSVNDVRRLVKVMRPALALLFMASLSLVEAQVMPGTLDPKAAAKSQEKKKALPGQVAPQKPVSLATSGEDTPTFRSGIQVVLVPTTVTDRKGNTINGLRPVDFTLYDNDKPQTINRDVSFLPLSLVIVIQRSNNVDIMLPKIRKMGNNMHDMLVGQGGEAAVIAFDHRIELLQDFTNDGELINEAVSKLKPGSETRRVNDAVQAAVRLLKYKKDRRKVILLLSETMDRGSEVKVREVAQDLQVHNVDVWTLNINRLVTRLTEKPAVPRPDPFPVGSRPLPNGMAQDPTSTAQMYGTPGYGADFVPIVEEIFTAAKAVFVKNPAEVYTKLTGGREYGFISQSDLEESIAKIGSEIRSQYILSYSPNNKMEGGFHRIKVEVNRPSTRIRTRYGYWMAAVQD